LIEYLKRKDYVANAECGEREALGAKFIDDFADACAAATPLMKFLAKALEVQF
jgi:hypothetical protein